MDAISDELGIMSNRIEELKGLVNTDRATIAQIAGIKRVLRDTHRIVEHFQMTRCCGFSEEIDVLAQGMTKHSWQLYRSALLLADKVESLNNVHVGGKEEMRQVEANTVSSREQTARVYIPTGAQPRMSRLRRESYRNIRIASSGLSGYSGSNVSDTRTYPPPKVDVKRRIQQEEMNARFTLHEGNTVRQGSCDGSSVAAMVMSGSRDDRLVLPNLHYIKVHELRALIEWMTKMEAVAQSGSMSCVEKVLHCIQLLQTGCRYESLAVIFSRSPCEIKDSCLEVMKGLLQLHGATVNRVGGQEMYMPLWKIWRKFEATKGRASAYYGFQWIEVAKVLVTLNLYIGRWRMQGMFATDGPTFLWGRFFVSHGGGGGGGGVQPMKRVVVASTIEGEVVDDDNDDSTGTDKNCGVQSVPEQGLEMEDERGVMQEHSQAITAC